MRSYQNRNQNRQRSRDPLERRMDKLIQTGKQVVDGVAGNRPGQKRSGWRDRSTRVNFDKVGRWMEDKIDWFFEDDEDWLEDEELDTDISDINLNKKRPLGAISLRVPKALPPQDNSKRKNLEENNEWPDDRSFKLSQWERKDHLKKQQDVDLNDSSSLRKYPKKRNLPRSSRRKY